MAKEMGTVQNRNDNNSTDKLVIQIVM